jgi:hypothetical protein
MPKISDFKDILFRKEFDLSVTSVEIIIGHQTQKKGGFSFNNSAGKMEDLQKNNRRNSRTLQNQFLVLTYKIITTANVIHYQSPSSQEHRL